MTRWLFIVGATLAVACSTEAQRAGRRPGQSIIFSSADDEGVSSNVPSLAAKPPELPDFVTTVQSPAMNFGAKSQSDPLPEPQRPAISAGQVQQMRRLLDERKNWALLTPQEIFGLPTQEKILGVQDRNTFGQLKNETVVAEYYERQEQLRARTNGGNFGAADATPHWDLSGGRELQTESGVWTPGGRVENSALLMNQFLNGAPDSRASPAQSPKNGWPKPFNLPASSPGPTPEKLAAMEQFQQLLKPRSPSGDTAKASSLGSPIFSPSSTAFNPASGQQAAVPVGASFTPLSSGIAMPAGVTTLPGLLGPTNTSAPAFAPEWKLQPPPWMSSAPQPGVIPQRKF
ncbi:MAG: hypothetical protein ABSE90_07395 [Verrucomicrobiota bacterium]